jgi:hypothetical protein
MRALSFFRGAPAPTRNATTVPEKLREKSDMSGAAMTVAEAPTLDVDLGVKALCRRMLSAFGNRDSVNPDQV